MTNADVAHSLRTCASTEPRCGECVMGVNGKHGLGCARKLKELAAEILSRTDEAVEISDNRPKSVSG